MNAKEVSAWFAIVGWVGATLTMVLHLGGLLLGLWTLDYFTYYGPFVFFFMMWLSPFIVGIGSRLE